jgi:transposase-like protein
MTTYTPERRAAVVATYREHGPSEAARRHGVAKSTATRWAQAAGLGPYESQARTRAATEAAQLSAKAVRAELAGLSLDATVVALARLTERLRDDADSIPTRDLAVIYGITTDKHVVIANMDDDKGMTAATSVIERMITALGMPDE